MEFSITSSFVDVEIDNKIKHACLVTAIAIGEEMTPEESYQ